MPYVPRPVTTAQCAHCNASFEKRHASRKYCSNSCNVLASYARTGYRSEGRPTRAELELTLAKLTELVATLPTPTAKAAATKKTEPIPTTNPKLKALREKAKTAKKALLKAREAKEENSLPVPRKPTAKAAAKPAKKKITATVPLKSAAQRAQLKAKMKEQLAASAKKLASEARTKEMDEEWEIEKRRREREGSSSRR